MSRCYLARLSVLSEHVASQSKWQSADLDLLKLAKKRKIVWTALFLGKVCIWFVKISNVSAILGRKSTARLKVNENTRSVSFCRGSRVEGNMSRVEVEGRGRG